MLRFLSALLLAVLILVLGYAGAWFYLANRAQTQLLEGLAEAFGGSVRVGQVTLQYDPMRLRFHLSDIEIETTGASGQLRLVHSFGEAWFERPLLDGARQLFILPASHTLALMRGKRPLKTYQVTMEKPRFIFFPNRRSGTLSFQNIVLTEKGQDLLRAGFGDLAFRWRWGEAGGDILLKELQSRFLANQPAFKLSTLSLNADFAGFPPVSHLMLPLLEERTASRLQDVGRALLPYLSRNKSEVTIQSLVLRWGKQSFVLGGQLGLDARERLQGFVNLTVSDKQQFFDLLEDTNLLAAGTLDMAPGLVRVIDVMHQPPYTFGLKMEGGEAFMGNSSIGRIVPLPVMLGLVSPGG
jgi:hypothetical protein